MEIISHHAILHMFPVVNLFTYDLISYHKFDVFVDGAQISTPKTKIYNYIWWENTRWKKYIYIFNLITVKEVLNFFPSSGCKLELEKSIGLALARVNA